MILAKVQITKFRCVQDSGEFSIDPKVTCLVGKNESGKSAILQAIEKLNPVNKARKGFDELDYPRAELTDYKNREPKGDVHAIRSVWKLTPADIKAIVDVVGEDVLECDEIEVSAGYHESRYWNFSRDEEAGLRHLLSSSSLYDEEKTALEGCKNIAEVAKAIAAKKENAKPEENATARSPRENELLKRIKGFYGERQNCWNAIVNILEPRLPRMVYFSDYLKMPGQVSLEDLNRPGATDEPGNQVFLALLSMVGRTPEALAGIGEFERLQAELEGVSNKLTREIFTFWTQNKQLKVQFRFDKGAPNDRPPFNSGNVMRTRIENTRHGVTTSFDDRSTGFVWFFSFLVWFSQAKKQYGDNLVVLLDEPGLSLHAKAQADLLRYFEKRLSVYQVIYSTHSPFMIDPANLMRARTVEDVVVPADDHDEPDRDLGTKVGDKSLSTDKDTIFPLQAALGYEITQSLFIGTNTLLVEGPSELLYLPWFSRKLLSANRIGLDKRWTLTPCGGVDKIPSFLALFSGKGLHIATLVDFADGGKKRVNDLRTSELLEAGHVFSAEKYCGQTEADVEDIIGREMYVALVNASYGLQGASAMPPAAPAAANRRVVKEAEQHFTTVVTTGPSFDHFSPASYLNQQPVTATFPGLSVALDRFEKLFRDLNAILP